MNREQKIKFIITQKDPEIAKDILEENKKENSKKRKLKKYKILMNDVKVELNTSDADKKKALNFLKQKINIISDSIALNMIENILGINKNTDFDINELFSGNSIKKKDNQKQQYEQIRKKAHNNYIKMVKLRYNLSEKKYSDLDNHVDN